MYRLPLSVLLLLTIAPGVPASQPLPGGVADAEGKVGYVHSVRGGVEAIDLSTGKVLWSHADRALPLAVVGNHIVCQAPEPGKPNQIRMIALNAADGKVAQKSIAIALPEWTSVEVTHGRSFKVWAEPEPKGRVTVRWEARAWYAGGARPTPEIEEAARKHETGAFLFHAESGELGKAAPAKKAEALKAPEGLGPVAQLFTGSDWLEGPQVIGDTAYAVLRKQAVGGQKLELATWPVGGKLAGEPKSLMAGKELYPQLAPDGKHLIVHQAIPPEQLQPNERVWTIFALPSGKQVATVPYEAGGQGLTVVGPRAFYTVGEQRFGGKSTRTLRAVDLSTGKTLWEHALWAAPLLPPLP